MGRQHNQIGLVSRLKITKSVFLLYAKKSSSVFYFTFCVEQSVVCVSDPIFCIDDTHN